MMNILTDDKVAELLAERKHVEKEIEKLDRVSCGSLKQEVLVKRKYEINRLVAQEFGRRNDWILGKEFCVGQLLRGSNQRKMFEGYSWDRELFDHNYYYKTPTRPHRPAAIVAHLYNYEEGYTEQTAAAIGLIAKRCDDFPSWWYPGWTKLIIYTPRSDIATMKKTPEMLRDENDRQRSIALALSSRR